MLTNPTITNLDVLGIQDPTVRKAKIEIAEEARELLEDTTTIDELNKEILIIPADQGNITTLLNKSEYETKIRILIKDTNVYEKIKANPTNTYQNINNKLVNRDKEYIDENTSKHLKINNARTPKIYGLLKVQKKTGSSFQA
ncbi:hypothetical protein JTB14_004491 [Gonioctena quinquepunctata]|nr:hypothetical protein JTB14_004491 [Gonioctena quinquepunctata]